MQKNVLKQHTPFFSPGVFIFCGTTPVWWNAMVFVVPSSSSLHLYNELRSSYCTLLIIVCCYPMPHSSVYFYQEIEDHQLKNDNQKNKKVFLCGHFVENFSITGQKKQVLYFPLNRLNPYDLYVAVVFVFYQLFSFWFSSPSRKVWTSPSVSSVTNFSVF